MYIQVCNNWRMYIISVCVQVCCPARSREGGHRYGRGTKQNCQLLTEWRRRRLVFFGYFFFLGPSGLWDDIPGKEEEIWVLDWCCFYYFVRNRPVALLEALIKQQKGMRDVCEYVCICNFGKYESSRIVFIAMIGLVAMIGRNRIKIQSLFSQKTQSYGNSIFVLTKQTMSNLDRWCMWKWITVDPISVCVWVRVSVCVCMCIMLSCNINVSTYGWINTSLM